MDDVWGWMESSELAAGATITVIRGGDLDTVLEAFGAEGAGVPVAEPRIQSAAWDPDGPVPWAVIAPVEGGVVAVEPNGFVGVRPAVLGPASRGGLAVAVYWNVNMLTDVEVAEAGAVVGGINDTRRHGDDRFAELVGPIGIPGDDELSPLQVITWGLRVQARVAGLSLTEELWRDLQSRPCTYLLVPPLPEHLVRRQTWHKQVATLLDVVTAADEAVLTELAWEAARRACGPDAGRHEVAATLGARRLDASAERAARHAFIGAGRDLVLWRMLHAATNPDAPSALLGVLADASFLLDGAAFADLLGHVREELA